MENTFHSPPIQLVMSSDADADADGDGNGDDDDDNGLSEYGDVSCEACLGNSGGYSKI